MSPQTPCPSAEQLRRSLDPDAALTNLERQSIEAHVDGCDRGCKAAIERLLLSDTLAADPDTTRSGGVSNVPAERPTPVIPGYDILGELGRGGMGVVYQARDLGLNRLVALKMILAGAHADGDDLSRFRTEAEAVAALQHPNVVQIYEIGQQDGCPYLSLELVEGGSLAGKLAGQPQPPRWAAELSETLARAVHFAHQQGFIHRDLKPANVLLSADGTPKITDFGLAKKLGDHAGQTQSGVVVGTPTYMAPEQMARQGPARVGTPADVYALGAILYECLTGRPPFVAPTAWDLLAQVVSAEPAPPRRFQPKIPADLETICLKCLHKEPHRRYGSAEALADDLRRFLTGRPIQARPVGVVERAVKWVRRNAVAATLAAVVSLALAVGVGGWLWAVQDRAARQAEADRQDAARLSAARQTADSALAKAEQDEEQAAAIERAADERGREEPQTPEAAKQALQLRRQAEATLDEAERALADVPGSATLRARLSERKQAIAVATEKAAEIAALLSDLDRARAGRARTTIGGLDLNAAAGLYAVALKGYGLDGARPEEDAAAQVRTARPAVRLALILALDDWTSCVRAGDAATAKRLSQIADRADDDDWRHRCRAALGNIEALKLLAKEAPDRRLPAVSLVQLGRDLNTGGARAEAAALLRAARRHHPKDFWVYFDLPYYLIENDRFDPAVREEAETCACAAVALRPESSAAHYNLGRFHYDRGDWAGAGACYKKAIELDPTFPFAHYALGYVLFKQRDWAGAAACFTTAIDTGFKYPQVYDALGGALFEQGDLDRAAACYNTALELDRNYAPAYSDLGTVLDRQGKRAEAVKYYKKAIEIDPKLARPYVGWGNLLRNQGDRAGAVAAYKTAIDLDPKSAAAHNGLGNVRHDQQDWAGAAVCYQKAAELDPNFADAYNGLGSTLYQQGNLAAAATHFKKALELDPKHALAHTNLGTVLMDRGDLAGAASHYNRALELDADLVLAHYFRGRLLYLQKDRAGAIACFKKALSIDPNYMLAHFYLGVVLHEQGDWAGATASYTRAIELDPNNGAAHYNLGLGLVQLGRVAEARTQFQRAFDLLAANAPLRASAADLVRHCDRMLALEAKLGWVLKGEREPADNAERLELAGLCESQHRYATAARFRREAFAHDAKLADDLPSAHRYTAVRDAARAACGQGADAKDLDDKTRAGWRQQALDWLRADLALRSKQLEGPAADDRKAARYALRYWQNDAALAGLRDAEELAKLPKDEREAWRTFWSEVQYILDKASEKSSH